MNKKRGQSLVEVLVAVSIITLVFAGTATLIVQVVNLELSARSRTEAVALGQKYLSESLINIQESCATNFTEIPDPFYDPDDVAGKYKITQTCIALEDDLTEDTGADCTENNFMRVNIDVTWQDKGIPVDETYTASQVVRTQND